MANTQSKVKLPSDWRKAVRKIVNGKVSSVSRAKDASTGKSVVTDYFLTVADVPTAIKALLAAGFEPGLNGGIGECWEIDIETGGGIQCFDREDDQNTLQFRTAGGVHFC